MLLEYGSFAVLCFATYFLIAVNHKSSISTEWTLGDSEKQLQFRNLQLKYLIAYLLATFSDWLQGPYVYRLYHEYKYDDNLISTLFLAGFLSSTIFGTVAGYLADRYGRKKLCILFCLLYTTSCFTKVSPSFPVLLLGRVLGGTATSILFSAFNAWYIHEHLHRLQLPPEWMNNTFARATFLNSLLAIVAGLLSSAVADLLGFGSISPFMVAIPVLLCAGIVIALVWEENQGSDSKDVSFQLSVTRSLHIIFSPKDKTLFHLGLVQMLFEPTMYTFVIAWTPILTPLKFSVGIVFSTFMLSIMLGSAIYTSMVSSGRSSPERLLITSMKVASAAMIIVAMLTTSQVSLIFTHVYYIAFLLFEISVGIYYPAWGYLASRTVPEELRASVTSWFRFPMNIITCICLQWTSKGASSSTVDPATLYHSSFVMCVALLLVAWWSSQRFSHYYTRKQGGSCSEIEI